MKDAILVTRRDEVPLLNVLGVGVQVLLDERDTDGQGVVGLCVCEPGEGAPPHTHDQIELFYVIEGTVSFFDGVDWLSASQGDAVKVPAGRVHGFRNDTEETVRFLTISSPAAHARFFREADATFRSGKMDPDAVGSLCRSNGIALA
ncbi:cupin domain-containing protein [Pelagicoccus sp. SDUM812003]|uniref:cupin domain-containing protein n=1 Tax=Pelagicoccus sp. SDUM812003 TaxID=3041267 RepID=UPI00280C8173|nr:cupin domain-containing protein [Pelagicoccus sp. SDUM812003]MDQ8205038.1 cupin domain-containing protein [Pelagicoccus sp. SDUM812003]